MDALHERISEILEVTRSSLAVHAGILDEVLERVQRLEERVIETGQQVEALAARLDHAVAGARPQPADGESRLPDDAGAQVHVVDLPAEEARGAGLASQGGGRRRWARSP